MTDISDFSSQRLQLRPRSEFVIFQSIKLSSLWGFIAAALLTVSICLFERLATFFLNNRFHSSALSPKTLAVRKTVLYALATTLRLLYMLISMSLNPGLIAIIVLSLSIGQLCIEYYEASAVDAHHRPANPLSSKASPYSPIPTQSMSPPYRKPYTMCSTDDVELAVTPSTSRSDVAASWAKPGFRNSRDQAKRNGSGSTSSSTLRNHQRNCSSSSARGAGFSRPGVSHARQSSNHHNGLTHTNSARKALFHIGSADDEKSTDSD